MLTLVEHETRCEEFFESCDFGYRAVDPSDFPCKEGDRYLAQVGSTLIQVYKSGPTWLMRFTDRRRTDRLMLGDDTLHLNRLRKAINRGLRGFHSQSPLVMVGGIAFHHCEAIAMSDLLLLIYTDLDRV